MKELALGRKGASSSIATSEAKLSVGFSTSKAKLSVETEMERKEEKPKNVEAFKW